MVSIGDLKTELAVLETKIRDAVDQERQPAPDQFVEILQHDAHVLRHINEIKAEIRGVDDLKVNLFKLSQCVTKGVQEQVASLAAALSAIQYLQNSLAEHNLDDSTELKEIKVEKTDTDNNPGGSQ